MNDLYARDTSSKIRAVKQSTCGVGRRAQDRHFGEFKAYTCNRYMTGGKAVCTSHYINFKVLTKLILLDIHAKARWRCECLP